MARTDLLPMMTVEYRWAIVTKPRHALQWIHLCGRLTRIGTKIDDPRTVTFRTRAQARAACRKISSWHMVALPVRVRVTVLVTEGET